MDDKAKTTVYLPAGDYRRLQALARAEGRPTAALIREAVAEYAGRRAGQKRPLSVGAFHSGHGSVSEDAEKLLEGFGES